MNRDATPSPTKSILFPAVGAAIWLVAAVGIGLFCFTANIRPAELYWTGIDPVTGEKTGGVEFGGWHVFNWIVPHEIAVTVIAFVGAVMLLLPVIIFVLFLAQPRA